jgi:AraC-like DNA-binding protein
MLLKVRSSKINFYLRFMRDKGFNSSQVLNGTNLSTAELAESSLLIDITSYVRIVSNIRQLYGSPTLAFDLGKSLTIGDLGILGYSLMTSENSYVAYNIYHKFSSLFFGNLIDVPIRHEHGQRIAYYEPTIDSDIRPELLQFLIEERINIDVAALKLYGWQHFEFPAEEWHLTYKKPDDDIVRLYNELIDVPVYFSAHENKMILKNNALSIRYPTHDKETNELLVSYLDKIHSNYYSTSDFTTQVRNILYKNLSDIPSVEEAATKLFCSKRTLNRKLNQEGTTFADLVAKTRFDAIMNYAATTHLSHEQIADKLGFSDARSLRRFFKKRTGKTISEYKDAVTSTLATNSINPGEEKPHNLGNIFSILWNQNKRNAHDRNKAGDTD